MIDLNFIDCSTISGGAYIQLNTETGDEISLKCYNLFQNILPIYPVSGHYDTESFFSVISNSGCIRDFEIFHYNALGLGERTLSLL